MAPSDNRPPSFTRIFGPDGIRYRFFCEASGTAVYTTDIISDIPSRDSVNTAWEQQGRQHFNRCQQCGRWVCNVMYNTDTGRCVLCSPWEESPAYCSGCGALAVSGERYCRRCGQRLRYGEVVLNE